MHPLLGTLTWNLGTCRLHLEPLLGTMEPPGSFTWTFTWTFRTFRNLYLEPLLGTSRNLAGWLPQSAQRPGLAETPKLSVVGEKRRVHTTGFHLLEVGPLNLLVPKWSHCLSVTTNNQTNASRLQGRNKNWALRAGNALHNCCQTLSPTGLLPLFHLWSPADHIVWRSTHACCLTRFHK